MTLWQYVPTMVPQHGPHSGISPWFLWVQIVRQSLRRSAPCTLTEKECTTINVGMTLCMERIPKQFGKSTVRKISTFLFFISFSYVLDQVLSCFKSKKDEKSFFKWCFLAFSWLKYSILRSFQREIVWQLFKINNNQQSHLILQTQSTSWHIALSRICRLNTTVTFCPAKQTRQNNCRLALVTCDKISRSYWRTKVYVMSHFRQYNYY